MDFDQSYDNLAEKSRAIRVIDSQDSYNRGLDQFLEEKSYRPTYEAFALKDENADKEN